MRIIFVGPPGVGKGTQSKRLAASLGIPHLSTGEMFRQAISEDSEVGRISKSYIDCGRLVPDEIVLQIMELRLQEPDCRQGYLLDGFPRTIGQATAFDGDMQAQGTALTAVLELKVDVDQIVERLAGRGRHDDHPEIIRKRLEHYAEVTASLVDYYQHRHLLHEIDGIGTPDEVFDRIQRALAGIRPASAPGE